MVYENWVVDRMGRVRHNALNFRLCIVSSYRILVSYPRIVSSYRILIDAIVCDYEMAAFPTAP